MYTFANKSSHTTDDVTMTQTYYRVNVQEVGKSVLSMSPSPHTVYNITWVRVTNNAFPKTVSLAFGGVFYWRWKYYFVGLGCK